MKKIVLLFLLLGVLGLYEAGAQTPPVGEGKPGDIAFGEPVFSVSSTASNSNPANAFDNNDTTYWQSASGGIQTIGVQLSSYQAIANIVLQWDAALATSFDIEFSGDGQNWFGVWGGARGSGSFSLGGRMTQFIRIKTNTGSSPNMYQLNTFEVYAQAATAPAPVRNLEACTLSSASWSPVTGNTVGEGTLLTLNVKSQGDCAGKKVRFNIYNGQGALLRVESTDKIDPVNLLVNGASTTWRAEYIGVSANPQFYFEVSLFDGTGAVVQTISSTDPMITVTSGISGSTYYIDPAGNNNNNGTSIVTPWADFTNLAGRNLQPGDQVLLKRGGIWNQQLVINGKGTSDNFITIGAYGSGPRPKICRNGDVSERVARINNPSYMKINSLEVCNAGAGIVVFYDNDMNNQSVYFNDILGYGFCGIYGGTGAHDANPAWRNYDSPDRVGFSYGLGITGNDNAPDEPGPAINDFKVTNSEFYKSGTGVALDWFDGISSSGGWLGDKFTNVTMDNLYLHDNDYPDVSFASIFMKGCVDCRFNNTLIDRGTGGALRGTSAIFMGGTTRVTYDNLTIINTPISWANDNTGIDFESGARDTLIQNSWFENNAGGAIEFLDNGGDNINVEIKNSVFANNGWAKKFANQGQISVMNWPRVNNSTGLIHDNWYINPSGVVFFGGDGASNGGFVLTNNNEGLPPVIPSISGDVNDDAQVNVLDIQACVNHILGIQDIGSRGDVNGDSNTDVLDVQAIVNIILGG